MTQHLLARTAAVAPALLAAASLACLADPTPARLDLEQYLDVEGAEPLAAYPSAPFEDRAGRLWLETAFSGVIRFHRGGFRAFGEDDGLPSMTVRDIAEGPDGDLWFATTGGVCRLVGERFEVLTAYEGARTSSTFAPHGDHRDVWDLHFDRSGTLWIATMAGVFRREGDVLEPFALPLHATNTLPEFGPEMVYCIAEDPDGALWFGTDGQGAFRFDGEAFEVYTAPANGLASDRVCAIARDRRGDLWFGTSGGGVSRFDGTEFTTHLRADAYSEYTGWGRYMAIHEDQRGHVWFGASMTGGGVHVWDGETWRSHGDADGLAGGAVPSIREDRSGHVWLGTTAGVFRFDGERFEHFSERASRADGREGRR